MEVLLLMIIVLTIFSLFALQAYQGVYTQKCIKIFDANSTNLTFNDWITNSGKFINLKEIYELLISEFYCKSNVKFLFNFVNSENWLFDNSIGDYAMCCNGTFSNEGRLVRMINSCSNLVNLLYSMFIN